jgi:hypothetical protein
MKAIYIVIVFLLITAFEIFSQINDSLNSSILFFDLYLIDLPYQTDAASTVGDGVLSFESFVKGYANPGMHQSLSLSADLYTALHHGIKKLFYPVPEASGMKWQKGKRLLFSLVLVGTDFLSFYLPGFDGWMHEEYHRSVLTRFHVNSFNDMNKFPVGAKLVNVSHVKDEGLIQFKQIGPADFIRSHVAGIEGEYLLTDRLQRNNFFYNQDLPHVPLYLFTTLNAVLYVRLCSDPAEADKLTNEANARETEPEPRDYTGLDFLAWTYDLFRPGEEYSLRGVHPSGNGLDRYIKTTDLTQEELSYLKKQGSLQWLNLISPMMIGISTIRLNRDGLYGNLSFRHYLTSFGNDISCNVLLRSRQNKFYFSFHSAQNYTRSYPALEAHVIDREFRILKGTLYFSPRILIGMQPYKQEFKTSRSAFLGLAEYKFELKYRHLISPFAEFSFKTDGWIAGNEFLSGNFSCRLGISSRIAMVR